MVRMDNVNSEVFSLECPVCTNQFTSEGDQRAISLLCGHFVCADCNQRLRNQKGPNYKCPHCCRNIGSTKENCCGLNELIKDVHDCFSFGLPIDEKPCVECKELHATILTNAHDLPGFRCAYKDCLTKFSTDSSSRSAPAFSICGHFVCVGCMEAYSAKEHHMGYRVQQHTCPKCSSSFSFRTLEVARGFIAFIEEITRKANLKRMKHCRESCRECHVKIISGRYRLCFQCDDDLLQPRPLCSECVLNGHEAHLKEVIDMANIERDSEIACRVLLLEMWGEKIGQEWKKKLTTAFNSMSRDCGMNLELLRKVETYIDEMTKMSTDYLENLKKFGDALFPSGNGARDEDLRGAGSPVENIPNPLPVEPMNAENEIHVNEANDNVNADAVDDVAVGAQEDHVDAEHQMQNVPQPIITNPGKI